MNWRYVIPAESMNQREGMRVTKAMLDKLPCPDVVVCLNDAIALGAIHELQRCGLHVPDDVQVVGFDNVPEAEYSVPALTTIDPHIARVRITIMPDFKEEVFEIIARIAKIVACRRIS